MGLHLPSALDEKDAQTAIETINRNARAQAQIIEDILDVSRIITGKLRLDVQLIDPGIIIESAIKSARPAAEAKSIRLQMTLDPHAGPVSGDPNRLQQVIWNYNVEEVIIDGQVYYECNDILYKAISTNNGTEYEVVGKLND